MPNQLSDGVTNIRIDPDPDNFPDRVILVHYGDRINCSASGRPPPSYAWHGEGDDLGFITTGPYLEITEAMVCEYMS